LINLICKSPISASILSWDLEKEDLIKMSEKFPAEAIFYVMAIKQFKRGLGMFADPSSKEPAFQLSWELSKPDNEWVLPLLEGACLRLCLGVGQPRVNRGTSIGDGVIFAGLDNDSLIIDVVSKGIRRFWNHISTQTLNLERTGEGFRLRESIPENELQGTTALLVDNIVRTGSGMGDGSSFLMSLGVTIYAGISLFVIGNEWDSHPEPSTKWAYARVV